MISLDDLRTGVDPLRGAVAFTVTLGGVPGTPDAGLLLFAGYDGSVARAASTWNLEAPTGPLGLGWRMPVERIVAAFPGSAAQGAPAFFLDLPNGRSLRLRATARDGDTITYVTDPYEFWVVTRQASADRWEILREDGRRWVYGEPDSGRGTVETGVRWGSWIGASVSSGQETTTVAWNLSRVVDLWGNEFRYSYRQVTDRVGPSGRSFTRATYFDRIVGPGGDSALFNYLPKTAAEYQEPHTDPAPPNAWQDRLEKEYLESIELHTRIDPRYTVHFLYDDPQGHPVFLGTGDHTKRLLTGIRCDYPDGLTSALPATRFTYVMDEGSPGYGSIASCTTSEGGTTSYTYGSVTPLGLCQRSTVVSPPFFTGVTLSSPRLWFADDYAVVTWQGTDQRAHVVAYAWEGRWIETVLGSLPVSDAAAYEALDVVTARTSFAVIGGSACLPYRVSRRQPGGWTGPASPFTLDLTEGEPVAAAAGEGLVVVLGFRSGKLNRVAWTGTAWAAEAAVALGGGAAGLQCSTSASDGFAVSCWTVGTSATDPLHVRVDRLDETLAWQTAEWTVTRPRPAISALEVHAADAFAVVVAQSPAGSLTTATTTAVWWRPDWDQVSSTLLGTVTAATVPDTVVHGSTVGMGASVARFDGATWSTQDLGDQDGATMSYGVDQAVATTTGAGGPELTVYVYDPDAAGSSRWTAPANLSGIQPGAGEFAARPARAGPQGSRWLLAPATVPSANALWYEGPDGTWTLVTRLNDVLTGAELASLQLLGERYCIYQSGANVSVLFLRDGVVTQTTPVVLSGEQILVPGKPPELLVGETAFATYTGTWGSAQSTLRLRRPVRGAVDGALSVVSLANVRQVTGYQDVEGANGTLDVQYAFSPGNATVDESGWIPAYNLAGEGIGGNGTTTRSFFNGLTVAESSDPDHGARPPYPVDSTVSNASDNLGSLFGAEYSAQALTAAGTAASETAAWWWAYPVSGRYDLLFPRERRVVRKIDGVPMTLETEWNPLNGFAARQTSTFYDGDGLQRTDTIDYRYFFEQYGRPDLNVLNALVQQTFASNGQVTSTDVRTWRDDWGGGPGRWAEFESYRATVQQPATFNRWSPSTAPLAAGWLLTESVVERTPRGGVKRTVDGSGESWSAVHDRDWLTVVASFAGANTSAFEAAYYGFEPYEDNVQWSYVGGSIEALVVDDDAHTGRRCLRFPNSASGSGNGPISVWPGTVDPGALVFSCWMRVPTGSDAGPGNSGWTITVVHGGTSATSTVPFPAATSVWTYVELAVDLPANTAQVVVSATNTSNMEAYVDELRVSPLVSAFQATVFDPAARRQEAHLGENGVTQRDFRDAFGRPVAGTGPGDTVEAIVAAGFSRDMNETDAFDPALPNVATSIASPAAGCFFRFGRGDAAAWTLPPEWEVAGWRLRFDGTATQTVPPFGGPATLAAPTLSNFAVRARFEPGPVLRFAGIGLDNLIVYWYESEAGWILGYQGTDGQWYDKAIRNAPRAGREWVLAVTDGRVFFWADGVPVFAYELTEVAPAGKLGLFLTDPGAFADVVLSVEPRISMSCADGAGQFLQQLDFADDETVVVTGVLTDAQRRQVVAREPVTLAVSAPPPAAYPQPSLPDQGRVNADVTTYLAESPSAGQTALTIPQYLAIDPPPFAQSEYEASPLGRITRSAATGTEIASAHASTFAWAQHTTTDVMAGLGYDAAPTNYQLQTTVDPNGNPTYAIVNARGQLLAVRVRRSGTGASSVYDTATFTYDGAGRPVKALPPSAFATSPPDDRWAVVRTYTFLGQLASVASPDRGETQYNYDEIGRLRYTLDANGAAASPQRIVYYLYDDLDRLVEEGTVSDAAVTFASIPQYAPYALPSGVVPAWHRRLLWDRPTDGTSAPNLVGRLWRVEVNNTPDGSPDTDTYTYDQAGNVVAQRTAVAGYDGQTYETAYRWDKTGELVEITYPRPLQNGAPVGDRFVVGRYFDRLGRLVGVGEGSTGTEVFDPTNPVTDPRNRHAETYAGYAYDGLGRLTQASLDNAGPSPIARVFRYDASSRLLQITGDYHQEVLTYETGGYEGAGYFDGTIASIANKVSTRPGADPFFAAPVSETGWAFAYDGRLRLVSAQSTADAVDASLDLGTGTPVTLDANGNLVTVPRPGGTETYAYAPETNRLTAHETTTSVTQDFTASTAGWTWGASNGGPSLSGIVADGTGGAMALELAGGSIGHAEELVYRAYMDLAGTYTLDFRAKSGAGFDSQSGVAGWYLQLFTSRGEVLRYPLFDASATTQTWQQFGPVNIPPLPGLADSLGVEGFVAAAGLVLVNGKVGDGGTAGASLFVTDITLAGSGSRPLAYDASGNVVAPPERGLTNVTYEPVTNRTSGITFSAGREAQQVSYAYGPGGQRSLESVTYATGPADKTLYLRGPGGQILMRRTSSGGSEQVTSYLHGARGLLAERRDTETSFFLTDHLGSTRAVARRGATSTAVSVFDYGPFGDTLLEHGGAGPYRYAGYDRDAASSLYDLGARLYDPGLRRFLQPDPLGADDAGYSYAAGDPVSRIDPDGNYPLRLLVTTTAWSTAAVIVGQWVMSVHEREVAIGSTPEAAGSSRIENLAAAVMTTPIQAGGAALTVAAGAAGSLAHSAVLALAHDFALARRFTSADLGATALGVGAVGSAGIVADMARRDVRWLFEGDTAWADYGWTAVGTAAFSSLANFVLAGGGFPRLFPSHTAHVGSFVGWATAGPWWTAATFPVPVGERGGATTPPSRALMQPIGRSWGCHHSGTWITPTWTPDHQAPNQIAAPLNLLASQRYFPHARSSWRGRGTQGPLMRHTHVVGGTIHYPNTNNLARPHAPDSFRWWRVWLPGSYLFETLWAYPLTGLPLAAWYVYTNYWTFRGWYAVWSRQA